MIAVVQSDADYLAGTRDGRSDLNIRAVEAWCGIAFETLPYRGRPDLVSANPTAVGLRSC